MPRKIFHPNPLNRLRYILSVHIILFGFLTGCALTPPATPIPTEILPTIIAQTLEASSRNQIMPENITPATAVVSQTASPIVTQTENDLLQTSETITSTLAVTPSPTEEQPTATKTKVPTATPSITPTLSPTPTVPSPTPVTPTTTPEPIVPEATIQIYQLGERSKVTSPLQVTTRITSRTGKVTRIELYGEDGRLLARQVKVYNDLPWHVSRISVPLDFEIRAAAEYGMLVVSVEDIHGRIMDVNSVNLVLLSQGETDLNRASALWQRIVIQEPVPEALVQGGSVVVSGLALPDGDQPLRVALITEDGRILGQRLAGLSKTGPGDYSMFIAEIPYVVDELTPVRLVVYEEGGIISDISHLTSIVILLTP